VKIICSLNNLSLTLGGKRLFERTGFTLEQGDHIGLLGLNGHGKSSLFKILAEQISADTTTPPFLFDKNRSFCRPDGKLDLFFIPQECDLEAHGGLSLQQYLWEFYPDLQKIERRLNELNQLLEDGSSAESLLNEQKELFEQLENRNAWSILQRYESYLTAFGLTNPQLQLRELSGGQQKKALLALGLSTDCPLILWDEPTNHLDLETLEQFEAELENLDKTYLMISHDRTFLAKVTNKILSIQVRKLHPFLGSYADYLTHLAEREQERLQVLSKLQNTLRRETEWMRQGIKARGTRSKKRVENFHDLHSRISTLKEAAHQKIAMQLTTGQKKTKILVDVKKASFGYEGGPRLFNQLDLELWRGDKVGLLGPNGVGKTTLLKLLLGELEPIDGLIKRPDELTVAYFSQNRDELIPTMTAYDYVGGGQDTILLPSGNPLHINGYLGRFLFEKEDIHKPLSAFSGGEKNRLQLARHLLKKADLWIFDEPTNDLDLETLQILEKNLSELKGTLILISHDRSFLAEVTNKIWLLSRNGTIESFEGGYSQVEEYIAVKQLEDQLGDQLLQQDSSARKTSSTPVTSPPPVKEPRDLALVQKDIEAYEQVIAKISESLKAMEESGDFTDDKAKTYGELSSRLSDLEEKLLGLYEALDQD
jgi:ABC transport system ATP-binding/permease protein